MCLDFVKLEMKLLMSEICKFGDCTPNSRNYIEGEKILNAEPSILLACGQILKKNSDDYFHIKAFCVQVRDSNGHPHEITAMISKTGSISTVTCTCKAGKSEKCKHVLAVLLYCNRNDIDKVELMSCTDLKCYWKKPHKEVLEGYRGSKVEEHECYKKNWKDRNYLKFTDDINAALDSIIFREDSSLKKLKIGRHTILYEKNYNEFDQNKLELVKKIVNNEECEIMQTLPEIRLRYVLRDCCLNIITSLYKDNREQMCLCSETSLKIWLELRKYRMTGSRCYSIFTYNEEKNQGKQRDWKKKSYNYFYPKTFRNKYTDHGNKFEPIARNDYSKCTNLKVVTCGAVISKSNSWISYSPDGVIFINDKPEILLEIKCPFEGATETIEMVLPKIKYINIDKNGNITLKPRDDYYGQIQLGMAVLNLKLTHFVIYCSFDRSFIITPVAFDEKFTKDMLETVQDAYFNKMLHHVCVHENTASPE